MPGLEHQVPVLLYGLLHLLQAVLQVLMGAAGRLEGAEEVVLLGGLVLGSGCEVPLNCKLENLKAMMDSVRA